MKSLLLPILLCCLFNTAFAQLSGKLTTETGQPVAFANVLLLHDNDSTLVKATLADDNGSYALQYNKEGKYILQISSVGYETWNSLVFELTTLHLAKDFGILILKKRTQDMGEVVVRSAKPLFQQQAYGTTINVESSLVTKGSSVLQVLERSPGVIIDHRNNDIALNGKSGVTILLNGKQVRMSMAQVLLLLDGMSADDIATIELLTTPPSGYDAEGSAGLINIILKKSRKKGTNGSFTIGGGYGVREKGTAGINLTHNSKKINLYGSYTFSHNRTHSNLFVNSSQDMPSLGGQLYVLDWNAVNQVQNSHDTRVGVDINLDPATTIGGNITWNNSTASSNSYNRLQYHILPDSFLLFDGTIKGNNHWSNLANTLYLEKQLGKAGSININLDYIYFSNNSPSYIRSSFVNANGDRAGTNNDTLYSPVQQGFANTGIRVAVGKIDYVKKWNEKIKIEAGIKSTHTSVSSLAGIESLVNGVWQNRDESSNAIGMHEWIGASYASINAAISPSVNLVMGARYEYVHIQVENSKTKEVTVDRRQGMLFPNFFLTKKLNDESDLQFSFTNRISRPTYNDLASYVAYADPSAVLTGNPFLKPTITRNLKLGYNYKNYAFSLVYSRDEHPIIRYQLTESPGRDLLLVSPQNLAWQNNLNLQTTIPVRVNNWWTMNYGFTGGLRQYKVVHTPQPAEKSYFGYVFNFSQSFILPKNYSMELSGWYCSDWYISATKGEGFGATNAGIKKELPNNKGSLQLSVTDIFSSMRIHSYYGGVTREAFNIRNHVRYSAESRKFPIIRITWSRSFGSASAKQRKLNSSDEEEHDRIRKE